MTRFFTVPGSPRGVYRWIHHHPPRGSNAAESYGDLIFWDNGPPGTFGATGVLDAVRRDGGGTAVRLDVFDSWKLPRDTSERVPTDARFLTVEVASGSGGIHREGETPPPIRYASRRGAAFLAGLARLIDRQPAFQLYEPPSCGPVFFKTRLVTLTFRDRPGGRVLARVSQEVPFGLCSALTLSLPGRRPYALEGGWNVLPRVHRLIDRAAPRSSPG